MINRTRSRSFISNYLNKIYFNKTAPNLCDLFAGVPQKSEWHDWKWKTSVNFFFLYLSSALSILRPGAISSRYTIRAERIQANSLKFKQFSKEIIYTTRKAPDISASLYQFITVTSHRSKDRNPSMEFMAFLLILVSIIQWDTICVCQSKLTYLLISMILTPLM